MAKKRRSAAEQLASAVSHWKTVVVGIAAIGVTFITADSRYAHSADVRSELLNVQEAIIEGRRDNLEKERQTLERLQRRTTYEDERLADVKKALKKIDAQLDAIGRAKAK